MRKGRNLTSKEHHKIRSLLLEGHSLYRVSRLSGRSGTTVAYIKESTNFNDYKTKQSIRNSISNSKKALQKSNLVSAPKKKVVKTSKKRVLTEEEFKKIKLMSNLGLTGKQVVELTGWSSFTVFTARRYSTLTEYQEYVKSKWEKRKSKIVPLPSIGIVPSISKKELNELPRVEFEERQVVALESIAKSLEKISEQAGKKRGLF